MSLFVHCCAGDGCSFPLESRQFAQGCQWCSWSHGRRMVGPVGLITERGNTQGSAQKQQEILAWVREWMPKRGYFHVNDVHCKKKNTEQGLGAWPPNPAWFDKLIPEQLQLGHITAPNSPKTRAAPGQQDRDPETSCAPRRGHHSTEPHPDSRRGFYTAETLTLQELRPVHWIRWHLSTDLSASLHQGLNCLE